MTESVILLVIGMSSHGERDHGMLLTASLLRIYADAAHQCHRVYCWKSESEVSSGVTDEATEYLLFSILGCAAEEESELSRALNTSGRALGRRKSVLTSAPKGTEKAVRSRPKRISLGLSVEFRKRKINEAGKNTKQREFDS